MSTRPRLLARTPAADGAFIEVDGIVWLMLADMQRPADAAEVDRAVRDHGYERDVREFGSILDLDRALEAVAAGWLDDHSVPMGFAEYDEADIEEVLSLAAGQPDVDGRHRLTIVACRLLRECPAARLSPDLHSRLVTLAFDQTASVTVANFLPVDSDLAAAIRRVLQPIAA